MTEFPESDKMCRVATIKRRKGQSGWLTEAEEQCNEETEVTDMVSEC